MSEVRSPNSRSKNRKWVKVLLVVSVTLNLLIVGLAVGTFLKVGGGRAPEHARGDQLLPLILALPSDVRRDMRSEVRSAIEGASPYTERLTNEALVNLLKSEPFDAESYRMHLSALRRGHCERLQHGEDILARTVEELSAEERAEYAERVERRFDRRRR